MLDEPRVSRRAFLGAGLGRLTEQAEARARRPPFRDWGEGDEDGLGTRLGPIATDLLETCGVRPGMRVLVACAGDGVLARAAASAGAAVTAVEASEDRVRRGRVLSEERGLAVSWEVGPVTSMPVDAAAFDAVVSLFGASYAADPRRASWELIRVAARGAPIALSAWTGLMAEVLRVAGPPATRSEAWSHYEMPYRHFFDFPGLDVLESATTWWFAGMPEAVDELARPASGTAAEARLRDALPTLLARHATPHAQGVAVAVRSCTAYARRP